MPDPAVAVAVNVVVVHTNDVVARRRTDLSNVWVKVVAAATVDDPMAAVPKTLRPLVRSANLVDRFPAVGSFVSKKNAIARRNEVAAELARQGYTVNPNPESRYSVYVIELNGDAMPAARLKRFANARRGAIAGSDAPRGPGTPRGEATPKGWLYVGETAKPFEERLADHCSGRKSARVVKDHYSRRRVDLEPKQPFHSRWDARAEETALGIALGASGFVIEGPQGMPNTLA